MGSVKHIYEVKGDNSIELIRSWERSNETENSAILCQCFTARDFPIQLISFPISIDAITDDLRSQADRLIDKMRDSMFIDYKRDWKLLTIMTGTKDLCHMCKNSDYSPSGYVRTLKRTLDRLQEEVPRMFVNLVQVYDVTELNKLHSPYCDIFYETLCPCATVSGRLEREKVKHAVKEYHRLTEELIKSGR